MIGQRFPKPSLVRFYALRAVPQYGGEDGKTRILGFPRQHGIQETWFDRPHDQGHPTVRRTGTEDFAYSFATDKTRHLVHRGTFDAVWKMATHLHREEST